MKRVEAVSKSCEYSNIGKVCLLYMGLQSISTKDVHQALVGEEETGRPAKRGRHKRSWEEASSGDEEDAAEQERRKAEEAREKDQAEKAAFEERLKAKVCCTSD